MLHLAARPGAPGATRLQDRSWPAGWERGKAAGARERSLSPGPCSRGPQPSAPLPTFSFPLTFAPEHWCSSPMCHMLCQECGHRGWRMPGSHDTRSPLKSLLIHLPEGPAHRQVWRRRGPAPTLPRPQTLSLWGRSGLPGQLEGERATPDLGQSHSKGELRRSGDTWRLPGEEGRAGWGAGRALGSHPALGAQNSGQSGAAASCSGHPWLQDLFTGVLKRC